MNVRTAENASRDMFTLNNHVLFRVKSTTFTFVMKFEFAAKMSSIYNLYTGVCSIDFQLIYLTPLSLMSRINDPSWKKLQMNLIMKFRGLNSKIGKN